jgi:hypothetical protein
MGVSNIFLSVHTLVIVCWNDVFEVVLIKDMAAMDNFFTCGCKLSAPFFATYKAGHEPTPYW